MRGDKHEGHCHEKGDLARAFTLPPENGLTQPRQIRRNHSFTVRSACE